MVERVVRFSLRGLVLGVVSTLLVIGTCTGGGTACRTLAGPLERADWLTRQAEAMIRGERGALDRLSAAPRYTIDAALDVAAAEIVGHLTLEYTHDEDAPLHDLVLRLWPNAETIYGGGSLTVEKVTRQGRDVSWRLEDDSTILSISLDPPLETGETTRVDVAFLGQIPRSGARGYHIYHASDVVTSLSGWHPILAVRQDGAWNAPPVPRVGDANLADIGLYEVHLQVPADYQVIATGTELGHQMVSEGIAWHLVSGPARGFAVMVSDRLQHQQETIGDVAVNVHTLAEARANISAQTTLDLAVGAVEVYQELFGPYPFAELDVVETLISIGGYEFPGLVTVEHDIRRRGSYGYYRWLVAHEVAHQWWYGLVGSDSVAEPWLDESLATYSVVLYVERVWGEAAAQAVLNGYLQTAGRPTRGAPPITSSALEFGSWSAYSRPIYYHGALFLADLREGMGDAAFFELLQSYYEAYRFGQATTADFMALAREIAAPDLDLLIERWFGSPEPSRIGGPIP
ncbi:MAG: M1 family metallopeptidase [Anaerolineae bacterium]|nr:M1 family metallopeptidase [Anaerolineae bacterium]